MRSASIGESQRTQQPTTAPATAVWCSFAGIGSTSNETKKVFTMTPNEIKFLMAETKVRQIDVARALGKTPAAVHMVIHGRSRNREIASEIASRLGVGIEEIIGNGKARRAA